jgi:hypothetical protein
MLPRVRVVNMVERSTSVYVGKIAASVPDEVVNALLRACGRIRSWKRQVDPETKQVRAQGQALALALALGTPPAGPRLAPAR